MKNGNIRIHCGNKEEAKKVEKVEWSLAYKGLAKRSIMYGINVNGVPIDALDITGNQEEAIAYLEQANDDKQLKIAKIKLLRHKSKTMQKT